MSRIYIRRYKRNPDFWEVVGGGKNIQVRSKTRAKEIAAARRRVRDKRKKRETTTRTKITKDRLGFWNVYITDQPLKGRKIQGNIVKSFQYKKDAEAALKKWKRSHRVRDTRKER